MAENLAKHFVGLRGCCLAFQTLAKLAFNHRKGSLNVRPLVILLLKPFLGS
jgi:hypothetical protein